MINLGRRIMVMGSSGSGKSTMAKRLGALTGLPVIHLDRLAWLPGWVRTPKDELDEAIRAQADQPAWIIDGDYCACVFDYRLERADTIIFLEFSRPACLYRTAKRRIIYHGATRPDATEGCKESFNWPLFREIRTYPGRRKGVLRDLAEIRPPRQVIHLKGNRAVRRFLQSL